MSQKFIKLDFKVTYVVPEDYFKHAYELDSRMLARLKEMFESWHEDESNPRSILDLDFNILTGDKVEEVTDEI